MARRAGAHQVDTPRGRVPVARSRSEAALQLARAINPGLGECITLGPSVRQLDLFADVTAAPPPTGLVVERDAPGDDLPPPGGSPDEVTENGQSR